MSPCIQVASADADEPGVVSPAFRSRINPSLFVMFCGAFEVSLRIEERDMERSILDPETRDDRGRRTKSRSE